MSFAAIAKLLGGIKQAVNPPRSVNQQALIEAASDFGHSGMPASVTEALATKYALDPYKQPQDRRTFFKNVLGTPARLRDIEQTRLLGQIDTAELSNQGSIDDLIDAFGPETELSRLIDLETMASRTGRGLDLFEYDVHGDRWAYEGDPVQRVLEEALQLKTETPQVIEEALAPESEESFITPWLKRFRR